MENVCVVVVFIHRGNNNTAHQILLRILFSMFCFYFNCGGFIPNEKKGRDGGRVGKNGKGNMSKKEKKKKNFFFITNSFRTNIIIFNNKLR